MGEEVLIYTLNKIPPPLFFAGRKLRPSGIGIEATELCVQLHGCDGQAGTSVKSAFERPTPIGCLAGASGQSAVAAARDRPSVKLFILSVPARSDRREKLSAATRASDAGPPGRDINDAVKRRLRSTVGYRSRTNE